LTGKTRILPKTPDRHFGPGQCNDGLWGCSSSLDRPKRYESASIYRFICITFLKFYPKIKQCKALKAIKNKAPASSHRHDVSICKSRKPVYPMAGVLSTFARRLSAR
jgi:hypothetical protein